MRIRHAFVTLALVAACGDDGSGGLSEFYPPMPPTGGPQGVWAGEITAATAAERLTGPAAQGQLGDFYLRNERARFIISAPTRVIGVVPQGGNVIDAALVVGGAPLPDHFGELSLVYKAGRTCEHTTLEIVADGSKGGAAVVRAIGKSATNDFINLRGIGALTIPDGIEPDAPDDVDCATTYILYPGATELEVYWSLYNRGDQDILAPLGTLTDTGGETEAWSNGRGFERAGIGALSTAGDPAPIDYVVYQGPGVAYGVVPRFDTPIRSAGIIVAGVSIVLFGGENLLDILDTTTYQLDLKAKAGRLQRVDLVLGTDAEDIDLAWRTGKGETFTDVGGMVTFSDGAPAVGARVGVFADLDGDGALDDTDTVVSYLEVDSAGRFAGKVPATGRYLVAAEAKDLGRSPAVAAGGAVALAIPAPVRLDYQLIDDATGETIPGRVLVVGAHPAFPDKRVWDTYDRLTGVVRSIHAVRGISTGAMADPPLYLPAGGQYRVFASRGTEWSSASARFDATASGSVELHLRRVVDTTGYLATEHHVHQVGSPDSPVGSDERVRSALSAGIELFSVTDHDVVSDLQPFVEALAADDLLRVVPGIETTPFVYGHFNAYPLAVEPNSTGGAIDWGRGAAAGLAMTPGEIFDAARARGARLVQVNHPRGTGSFGTFQQYFDRANLKYDYQQRTIFGDFANAALPNEWLRLPAGTLWDDGWNALEIWNGFSPSDSDGDGVRELTALDRVLHDWFNMLNFGYYVAPIGNSDTHSSVSDPVGMPRTLVRVPDDSGAALADGSAVGAVMTTLEGTTAARDVVVTNGPMLAITVGGMPAIGRQVPVAGGNVTLTVTITAPTWADFDTLEVFANIAPVAPVPASMPTSLVPLKCWTSRSIPGLDANDPCAVADLAPEAMTVQSVAVSGPGGHRFLRATVTVTLATSVLPRLPSATGTDAWLVFRARGDKGVFPLLSGDVIDETTLPVFATGSEAAIDAALIGRGIPAAAFAAPVFLDVDGGGYRAPFQP